jgi:SAM-dependent methyltransferase
MVDTQFESNGILRSISDKMAVLGLGHRRDTLQSYLPISNGVGLEVAPNWAPIVTKAESDVLYCDYLTYDELVSRELTNIGRINHGLWVQRLDFVWEAGKALEACAPPGAKFDYIVSSHVLEHVPDFLGYLYQMRTVLRDSGVIAFALPDIRGSGEYFRRASSVGELLNAYLTAQQKPSPAQTYDWYQNFFLFRNVPLEGETLSGVERGVAKDADCLALAERAVAEYMDVHCWAFSKSTFADTIGELKSIGLFDFDIEALDSSAPTATGHGSEFYVKLSSCL